METEDDDDRVDYSTRAKLRAMLDSTPRARKARQRRIAKKGDARSSNATGRTASFNFRCRPDLPERIKAAAGDHRGAIAEFMEIALERELARRMREAEDAG